MNSEIEERMEKILRLMQADKSVDAPEDAVLWSKNIFRTREASRKPTLVEKITAVLRAELGAGTPVPGERSAAASAAKQMLFEAGDTGIDLRISDADGTFSVRGQILGDGFEGCDVTLGAQRTSADDYAEFRFDEVEEGEYDLSIVSEDKEILIERIRIG